VGRNEHRSSVPISETNLRISFCFFWYHSVLQLFSPKRRVHAENSASKSEIQPILLRTKHHRAGVIALEPEISIFIANKKFHNLL
jgi:hypothetical protein